MDNLIISALAGLCAGGIVFCLLWRRELELRDRQARVDRAKMPRAMPFVEPEIYESTISEVGADPFLEERVRNIVGRRWWSSEGSLSRARQQEIERTVRR